MVLHGLILASSLRIKTSSYQQNFKAGTSKYTKISGLVRGKAGGGVATPSVPDIWCEGGERRWEECGAAGLLLWWYGTGVSVTNWGCVQQLCQLYSDQYSASVQFVLQ